RLGRRRRGPVSSGGDRPDPPRSGLLPWLLFGLAVVAAVGGFAFLVADSGITFSEGDTPRLIGLIAILAFVAAGVVGRQMRAWHVIRALVVWALIIVV